MKVYLLKIALYVAFTAAIFALGIFFEYRQMQPVSSAMESFLIHDFIIDKNLTLEECIKKFISEFNIHERSHVQFIFAEDNIKGKLPLITGGISNSGDYAMPVICNEFYGVNYEYSRNFIIIYLKTSKIKQVTNRGH